MIRLTTPIQLVLALAIFLPVGLYFDSPLGGAGESSQFFTLAILLQCIAAFVENLVEPYYYTMLWRGDLQGKVRTELVALTLKSLLTYGLLIYDFNLLAYSLAQLAYSIVLLIMYPLLVKIEMPLAVTPFNVVT